MVYDKHELAWAAGFYDGEGCCTMNLRVPRILVRQVEREPLDRFLAAVKVGKIYGPYKGSGRLGSGGNVQDYYQYQAGSFEKTQQVAAALWADLCSPKREQITRRFKEYRGRCNPDLALS